MVLKRGEQGCVGRDGTAAPMALPAHAVTVVDPTGAGDCFCAHLRDAAGGAAWPCREALARANAAGALAVTALGPMEGNATLAEIEAFMARRA